MAIRAKVDEILSDVKSITSIPFFALSPAKKVDKEDGEGKKDEKMKTRFLEAWNNLRYDLGAGTTLKKDVPIWILGVCHHSHSDDLLPDAEEEEVSVFGTALAKRVFTDFASRPWFTYRKNFPPISGTDITSDTGWGCMLRSAQMMVAQGLIVHFLGREWRWPQRHTSHEKHLHRKIFGWFIDDPGEHCPLSIHHLSEIGRAYGNVPGNWYGPNTVAYIMKQAMKDAEKKVHELKDIVVYVAQDCTVYSEDVYDICGWRNSNEVPKDESQLSSEVTDRASECTSSASSGEELSFENMSSYFVPQITTDQCIKTSKIVNNMIPMTEFNNAKLFQSEIEVETWISVENGTPTENKVVSTAGNLPKISSGNRKVTVVDSSAPAANNIRSTLSSARTSTDSASNLKPDVDNNKPAQSIHAACCSNITSGVRANDEEDMHACTQPEPWVKVASRPRATEQSFAKSGNAVVAGNIGKSVDAFVFLAENTPQKTDSNKKVPKHLKVKEIVSCNDNTSISPAIESIANQSEPTKSITSDTNSNAKSKISHMFEGLSTRKSKSAVSVAGNTSENVPRTLIPGENEKNMIVPKLSKIGSTHEEFYTPHKNIDSCFTESKMLHTPVSLPIPPGAAIPCDRDQENLDSSNEMFLSSYIEISSSDDPPTLLPQKKGTTRYLDRKLIDSEFDDRHPSTEGKLPVKHALQSDPFTISEQDFPVRAVISSNASASNDLHTSDKDLSVPHLRTLNNVADFPPITSSRKATFTHPHTKSIPPCAEDCQNLCLNPSLESLEHSKILHRSSKLHLRRQSSAVEESEMLHDEGWKIPPKVPTPSAPTISTSSSKAVLILVPVRLGESSLNPIYAPCITSMLTLDSSIGIIGGKPKHSLYFVGYQGENLIHLDPHYCQIADTFAGFKKNLHDYHTMSARKINIKKIDPSCCLGFYCRTAQDFEDFKRDGQKTLSPLRYPMCLIMEGRSREHRVHSPTRLGNHHEVGETAMDPLIKPTPLPFDETERYSILDDVGFTRKMIFQNPSRSNADVKKNKPRKKSKQERSRLNMLNPFPSLMSQRSSSPVSRRKTRISEESLESQFELL